MAASNTKSRGMAALYVVLVISGASLLIAKSLSMTNLKSLDAHVLARNGRNAENIANSCANDMLERLRRDWSYTALNESLEFEIGSCIINVREIDIDKEIEVTSTFGQASKKVKLSVYLDGEKIKVREWKVQLLN